MPDFTTVCSNQLDPESTAWFAGVLEVIESLDADAYVALMSDDVELRLPDGTTRHGRDKVRAALHDAWRPVTALLHEEINLYGRSHHLVHEAIVATTTKDGQTVRAPSTSWIDRDPDGLIRSARVYG